MKAAPEVWAAAEEAEPLADAEVREALDEEPAALEAIMLDIEVVEVVEALPLEAPEAAEEPEAAADPADPVTPAFPAALVAVALRHEELEPAWISRGEEYWI